MLVALKKAKKNKDKNDNTDDKDRASASQAVDQEYNENDSTRVKAEVITPDPSDATIITTIDHEMSIPENQSRIVPKPWGPF